MPSNARPPEEGTSRPSPAFDWLSKPPVWIGALIASAIAFAVLQTFSVVRATFPDLLVGCVTVAAIFAAAGRPLRVPAIDPAWSPWLVGLVCLPLGYLAGTFWPNSGDEHSYVFLADTLLAGRLVNPPAPDPELFSLYRVFTMRGATFSQYLPGWPLVLAPFRFAGVAWLANPVLTALLGACLLGAMRRLRAPGSIQPVMLLLVLTSPFVLFNGASLFSGTLSAALAAAIAWQQLVDEEQPSSWRKVLIGVLFGLQLLTRLEMFLLIGALYAADRLWRRRWAAFGDAVPVCVGAFPLIMFFFVYNWAITGNPLQTPMTLTNPDLELGAIVTGPWVMAKRALHHTLYWTGELGEYGGLVLLVLQIPALVFKARRRSLRFFDLALPATIVLFLFFPHDGDHQYGPRYWFPAWPLAALTIASGFVEADGSFVLWRRRLDFNALTVANVVFCLAVLPGLVVTTRAYIDARRAVLVDTVPVKPAIVLVPTRQLKIWPWQRRIVTASSLDFARGDVDYRDPVLFGRLDAPDAVARACRLSGRAVFAWRGPGDLVRQDCAPESMTVRSRP